MGLIFLKSKNSVLGATARDHPIRAPISRAHFGRDHEVADGVFRDALVRALVGRGDQTQMEPQSRRVRVDFDRLHAVFVPTEEELAWKCRSSNQNRSGNMENVVDSIDRSEASDWYYH